MQLSQPVDVFLSHDWPQGVLEHGDYAALFRRKPFFAPERRTLGNPGHARLLATLMPSHWFSAHLHTRFTATVNHPGGQVTHFLALDKVGRNRQYVELVDLPERGQKELSYDPEWLSIVAANHFSHLPLIAGLQPTPVPLIAQADLVANVTNTDFQKGQFVALVEALSLQSAATAATLPQGNAEEIMLDDALQAVPNEAPSQPPVQQQAAAADNNTEELLLDDVPEPAAPSEVAANNAEVPLDGKSQTVPAATSATATTTEQIPLDGKPQIVPSIATTTADQLPLDGKPQIVPATATTTGQLPPDATNTEQQQPVATVTPEPTEPASSGGCDALPAKLDGDVAEGGGV
eukprot:TRINITY_DN5402_c0_g1_i2.p2 TRINITY_DN5402_c0_g1~~TRINITY_DN5402_c0_g1_i2.p2  ORF type:complete len:348 (+),score=77.26 TRINITY_DN5402_c0_g1_i2:633-1676(+)